MKKSLLGHLFCLFCFSSLSLAQGKLDIQAGAFLNTEGQVFLTCTDTRLVNNGNLEPAMSIITFENSDNQDIAISGLSTTPFYQLRINMQPSELTLDADIEIRHSLQFISGQLELSNRQVLLAPNALLVDEEETRRAKGINGGQLIITLDLNSPLLANPGNLGLEITTPENLGLTTIRRGHVQQSLGTSTSIARWFDLGSTFNSNLSTTLRIYYFDAELQGISEGELGFWQLDSGNATFLGNDNRDVLDNWVELQLSSLKSGSRWTLGAAPPITITYNSSSIQSEKVKAQKLMPSKINVYPNPVSEVLQVQMDNYAAGEITLSVFDISGRLIRTKKIDLPNIKTVISLLKIKELQQGTYFLKVNSKEETPSLIKFVKVN